jgi:hypothetical protein
MVADTPIGVFANTPCLVNVLLLIKTKFVRYLQCLGKRITKDLKHKKKRIKNNSKNLFVYAKNISSI